MSEFLFQLGEDNVNPFHIERITWHTSHCRGGVHPSHPEHELWPSWFHPARVQFHMSSGNDIFIYYKTNRLAEEAHVAWEAKFETHMKGLLNEV